MNVDVRTSAKNVSKDRFGTAYVKAAGNQQDRMNVFALGQHTSRYPRFLNRADDLVTQKLDPLRRNSFFTEPTG